MSTLELFFDLVFVFTVTQVALIVEEHDGSPASIAQAFVELLVIFWMYDGYAWLTNVHGSTSARQRAVLLAGMAAFFVTSLCVPRAFSADGIAFGIAYLVLTVIHLAGFLMSAGPSFAAMVRIGAANVTAAVLLLVAGFTSGDAHWPLWIAAVLIQVVPPFLTTTFRAIEVNAAHFAERHGLMVIIVLGESLISVALAAHRLPVDARLVVGALCGLAALAAMWWCYFSGEDEAAAARFARLPAPRSGPVALLGYDLPHVLMLAGVVALAAGTRLSLPDLLTSTSSAAAVLIAAGAAVYLAALAGFRAMLGHAAALPRAAGAVVLLALIPLGRTASAAAELCGVAVVLVALLLAERLGPSTWRVADPAG